MMQDEEKPDTAPGNVSRRAGTAEPEVGAKSAAEAMQEEAATSFNLWPWMILLLGVALLFSIAEPPSEIESSYISGTSQYSRVHSDMRSLATAIEAYMVESNQYPACAKGDEGMNAHLPKDAPSRRIWTFRVPVVKDRRCEFMTLTTPTAFIFSYPTDPFADHKGSMFGYYNAQDAGWILFSPGPDFDYDLTQPESYYNPYVTNPTIRLIVEKTYDPTNGAHSDGDIWRVKQ